MPSRMVRPFARLKLIATYGRYPPGSTGDGFGFLSPLDVVVTTR
jgi:hypothetical protein